ncbi:MAG: methyltransferase domain-containing protein [Phycisphaeraceae bacterium]|nr:methyltransferase domain-containing protein [Phycisphaeraceae bacterium]
MDKNYRSRDPRFFEDRDQITRTAAEAVVPLMVQWFSPRSVIDLGCGVGTWLKVFAEHGIERIHGVEGTEVDPADLKIPVETFERYDLSRAYQRDQQYDLAMSLEVAEHIPPESADGFVDSLVGLAPVVLFSAAVPGQGGIHHVNEQWPDYWVSKFDTRGYRVIDAIRPRIWRREDLKGWYRQNMLLFVADQILESSEELKQERANTRMEQLNLVHPQILEWKIGSHAQEVRRLKEMTLGKVLRLLPGLVRQSVAVRWRRLTGRESV